MGFGFWVFGDLVLMSACLTLEASRFECLGVLDLIWGGCVNLASFELEVVIWLDLRRILATWFFGGSSA